MDTPFSLEELLMLIGEREAIIYKLKIENARLQNALPSTFEVLPKS